MTYREIYDRAVTVIGTENIDDYRPATIEFASGSMLDVGEINAPNTIIIWLKNGDCIWYKAVNYE